MTPVSSVPAAARAHQRIDAEAARYGVLRRLAPALKHDMVVNLQAVAMMAEVMNARLEKGESSAGDLQKNMLRINRLAREAVMSCLKATAWIEPVEDEGISLRDGVDECIALLRSNFNFRGFSLANEVPDSGFEVSRVLLRNLLAASLISLADEALGPGDVLVSGAIDAGSATLAVRYTARADPADVVLPPFEASYRALAWADVQALAACESVALVRGAGHIGMTLPRMVALTPLKIVPL